jgi:hypothetical protein
MAMACCLAEDVGVAADWRGLRPLIRDALGRFCCAMAMGDSTGESGAEELDIMGMEPT